MERIAVRCPKCGHRMDIDAKIIAFKCSQCGAKIDLDEKPVSDVKEDSRGWQEFNQYNTAHTTRKVNDTIMHVADRIAEDREKKRERIEREQERIERQRQDELNHPFKYAMAPFISIVTILGGFALFMYIMELLSK